MNNLFRVLFTSARAKIMHLLVKLRMWSSPAYIKARVLLKVRDFFTKLLDVRPKHKQDYYSILYWLVSKRLAFALVVVLGLLSAFYIFTVLPDDFLQGGTEGVPTYKYRSIALKFHSGPVKILGRDGYVAYDGEVNDGVVTGKGVLYAPDGSRVYEGQFENNMYNGSGTQYYPSGVPQHVGTFVDNLYHGTGSHYRDNGTQEYNGGYENGLKSGAGVLYNSVGAPVFQGNFLHNEIVYSDFLARPTNEVSSLYSGATQVYQSQTEYCSVMSEIDALYSVKDGSNTLENQWKVDRIYVLKDQIQLSNQVCTNLRQLISQFGDPLYYGTAWVNLTEAVAWNLLAQRQPDLLEKVDMNARQGLEDIYTVSQYDRDFQIYLYTFEKEGLLYTFYFYGAGESDFLMYAMEKA